MQQNLQHTMALLARTPSSLNALLRDLPQEWTMQNEGGNTFNAFDVIGHLIHGERTDWMQRAKRILEFGESRALDPFDRRAQDAEPGAGCRHGQQDDVGALVGRRGRVACDLGHWTSLARAAGLASSLLALTAHPPVTTKRPRPPGEVRRWRAR